MILNWFGNSHPGLVRQNNQDCYSGDPEIGLWVLCDGMGGHQHGEKASRITVDTINKMVKNGVSLTESILKAHQAVRTLINPLKINGKQPGSTVVALRILNTTWEIVWLGDSRAWTWNGIDLQQLTIDHTPVQEMITEGNLSLTEARLHPWRHYISQALGMDCDIVPGHLEGTWDIKQEAFILTSDGAICHKDPEICHQTLIGTKNPQEAVEKIISASIDVGGHDNITVVVVGWPSTK